MTVDEDHGPKSDSGCTKNHRVTALFVVRQVIAQSDSHLQHLCIIYSC